MLNVWQGSLLTEYCVYTEKTHILETIKLTKEF